MSALTAKQSELLRYIRIHQENAGESPSFDEMREALALKSKSGVHRLIQALEERGYIRRIPNRARCIEVVTNPALPNHLTTLSNSDLAKAAQMRGLVVGHIQAGVFWELHA